VFSLVITDGDTVGPVMGSSDQGQTLAHRRILPASATAMPTTRQLHVFALTTALIVSACAGSFPMSETADTQVPTDVASPAALSTTTATAPSSGDRVLATPDDPELATVDSVTDGDTIRVSLEGGPDTAVRLVGINSPETGECFAEDAARVLATLVPEGTVIGMTRDVSELDEFGRLLRYLWRDGMSVNEDMVRLGAALARRYPPDTTMAETLEMAQVEASEAQRGLWDPEVCGPRSDAELGIAELEHDPPGDDSRNLNQEWIVIRNEGSGPVDLSGWGIRDESARNRYLFPDSFTLAPGETVTVRSGCGDDSGTDLYWCSVGAAIWNNDGDTAFLHDPNGNTHASLSYQGG
jgi:micrococcal nuclease